MLVHRFRLALALAAGLFAVAFVGVRADDASAKPKLKLNRDAAAAVAAKVKTDDDKKADEKKDDAKKEEKKDRFVVPEGGVKELLAFIQETMKFRPTSREEVIELRQKGFAAMKEAAEKIKKIATEEDKKLPGYDEVEGLLLYFRAQEVAKAAPEDKDKLAADLKAYFTSAAEPTRYAYSAAMQLSSALEHSDDTKAAADLNRELGAILVGKTNKEAAKWGQKMEGAARRLELPGHTMDITGTQLDGSAFEWSKYRGKVVLVDFWATWCGPCIGELPNVKKNYELYHDKGFDIVGISLDSDRKKLEEFVVKEQLPWATIYEGGGWETPMAVYYGINSIPRPILVDKEGKVISMQARGDELGRLLAEQLGPAEPPKSDEKPSDDDKPADKKE